VKAGVTALGIYGIQQAVKRAGNTPQAEIEGNFADLLLTRAAGL